MLPHTTVHQLRAGDVVIFQTAGHMSQAEREKLVKGLTAMLPGVRVAATSTPFTILRPDPRARHAAFAAMQAKDRNTDPQVSVVTGDGSTMKDGHGTARTILVPLACQTNHGGDLRPASPYPAREPMPHAEFESFRSQINRNLAGIRLSQKDADDLRESINLLALTTPQRQVMDAIIRYRTLPAVAHPPEPLPVMPIDEHDKLKAPDAAGSRPDFTERELDIELHRLTEGSSWTLGYARHTAGKFKKDKIFDGTTWRYPNRREQWAHVFQSMKEQKAWDPPAEYAELPRHIDEFREPAPDPDLTDDELDASLRDLTVIYPASLAELRAQASNRAFIIKGTVGTTTRFVRRTNRQILASLRSSIGLPTES